MDVFSWYYPVRCGLAQMGKNCGYSSSEGLFAVDSLTEDSITAERSEELLVNPQLLKLWLTLSCQELYCERLQHPGQVFL